MYIKCHLHYSLIESTRFQMIHLSFGLSVQVCQINDVFFAASILSTHSFALYSSAYFSLSIIDFISSIMLLITCTRCVAVFRERFFSASFFKAINMYIKKTLMHKGHLIIGYLSIIIIGNTFYSAPFHLFHLPCVRV